MKTGKKVLSMIAAVSLVCAFTVPFASAAPAKVYEKDVFLNDDNTANSGWHIIADDPGFYYDADGEAVHKSPSLWNKTSKSDPKFSWKYDTSDCKNGTSSLAQTYSTGFFYYWLTEFSGKTLDITNTQYLLMDLYVDDAAIFLNAHDFRVDFTDSTDKNDLKWDTYTTGVSRDTLKGTFLRKGWNSLKLYLGGTDGLDKINLKAITGIRFFAVGLSGEGTHTVKLDNVHLVSQKYTTQTADKPTQPSAQKPVSDATNQNTQNTAGTTASTAPAATSPSESTVSGVGTTAAVSSPESQSGVVSDEPDASGQDPQTSAPSDDTNIGIGGDAKTNLWVWLVPVIAVVAVLAAGTVIFMVIKRKKAGQ